MGEEEDVKVGDLNELLISVNRNGLRGGRPNNFFDQLAVPKMFL